MRNLYFVILALLIGCAKPHLEGDNHLTITAFSTSFDTKASETAFESGDVMGVFMENNAGNLRYETSDGVSWKGYGNLTQFKTGDNVTAYYPYSETATNMNAIEISSGVDFMVTAKTPLQVTDNKANAALNFKHVLSKLVVSMEIPSEINGLKTVSLESITVKNVFRKGVIDITTKAITGLTDVGDVVLTDGEAIIIPQTISRIEFIFKMENGTFMKQVYPENLLLESGKKTTLKAVSNADLYFTSTLDLKSGEAQTNLPLSFYVAPGRTWTLKSSAPWLTLSATTGVGAATVKVSVPANYGAARTAIITLEDDKQAVATQKPMQNYTRTVTIAGTRWTTSNLTGTTPGQTSGFTLCPNPQDYGMFWKWGSAYMYPRVNGNIPSGHWSGETTGAGSYPDGDPCKSLGAYYTPTKAQFAALIASGASAWTTYKGVYGHFFGPNVARCSNTTIADGCIFIPGAGHRYWGDGELRAQGAHGDYWASTSGGPTTSYYLGFVGGSTLSPEYNGPRGYAFSVRCVAQ